MGDAPEKPWYAQLPAKLAAIVVFLVALTTLAGNIFELVDKRRTASAPVASVPRTVPSKLRPPAPP